MSNEAKLQPCPFCGSENLSVTWDRETDDHYVECDNCLVKGGVRDDYDQAVAAWDRRTVQPHRQRLHRMARFAVVDQDGAQVSEPFASLEKARRFLAELPDDGKNGWAIKPIFDDQSRIELAYEFVGWYRNMVMGGQIEVSRYAIERMPYSDYELEQELRRGLNRGSDFKSPVTQINVYLRNCVRCRAPFRTFRGDQTECLSCGDPCVCRLTTSDPLLVEVNDSCPVHGRNSRGSGTLDSPPRV